MSEKSLQVDELLANIQAHWSELASLLDAINCNSCEGAGSGLRTYLRTFRGVHKYYLADYVATYETMANAKRITPTVVRRMCFGDRLYTHFS
jgi:transposase-like protein